MLCFVAQHLMRVMRLSLVILCILRLAARAHTTSLYHGTSKYLPQDGTVLPWYLLVPTAVLAGTSTVPTVRYQVP